jgi:hypothetical protein
MATEKFGWNQGMRLEILILTCFVTMLLTLGLTDGNYP